MQQSNKKDIKAIIGRMFSFNSSLKLFHWNTTGEGSYAKHMALDEAIDDLLDIIDRLVETTFAKEGSVAIIIPETVLPLNIVKHCQDMYDFVDNSRPMFTEKFSQAIIDDYQEAIKNLLYRLIRLQ